MTARSTGGGAALFGSGRSSPHPGQPPRSWGARFPSRPDLPDRCRPDWLIIKGWSQDDLDAGRFPKPSDPVTLIFIEYKTCDDFTFDSIRQNSVWDIYTPTPESPRPQRRHLFEELRSLGWTVLGETPSGTVTTNPSADRMLVITIGHGAFIPQCIVDTVFCTALGLPKNHADKLEKQIVQHQILSAAKIHGGAANALRSAASSSSTIPSASPVSAGVG